MQIESRLGIETGDTEILHRKAKKLILKYPSTRGELGNGYVS